MGCVFARRLPASHSVRLCWAGASPPCPGSVPPLPYAAVEYNGDYANLVFMRGVVIWERQPEGGWRVFREPISAAARADAPKTPRRSRSRKAVARIIAATEAGARSVPRSARPVRFHEPADYLVPRRIDGAVTRDEAARDSAARPGARPTHRRSSGLDRRPIAVASSRYNGDCRPSSARYGSGAAPRGMEAAVRRRR